MKNGLVAAISGTALGAIGMTVAAQQVALREAALRQFNIPAQPLKDALAPVSQQADLELVYYSELGDGKDSPRLAGTFTPQRPFKTLLSDTALIADFVDPNTVVIRVSATHNPGRGEPATGPKDFTTGSNSTNQSAQSKGSDRTS